MGGVSRLDDRSLRPDNAGGSRRFGAGSRTRIEQIASQAGGFVKGKISRREGRVAVEFDLQEWSHLKSIILFARKAANGPLFANDVESPAIESLARTLLDELGFERSE